MIQPNEIRINNYYRYPNTEPFRLTKEDLQSHRFWEDIDIIEPVSLSEEILEKCGLRLSHWMNKSIYDFCMGILVKGDNDKWKFEVSGNFDTIEITEIEYLHQLQNLHLDLTQKELQYNGLHDS